MIPVNVWQRILHIKTRARGASTGTAFIVEYDRKSYIVTARHLLHDDLDSLDVRYQNSWRPQAVRVLGVGEGNTDVAVLAYRSRRPVAPYHPVVLSNDGVVWPQTAYFLGYPYGWDGGNEHLRGGFPLPFVKAGVISGIPDSSGRMWLDAHGNEGFSGGPLVFQLAGSKVWNIGGIVTSLCTDPTDPAGRLHAGFVIAENIAGAIELIEGNPDGVPVAP